MTLRRTPLLYFCSLLVIVPFLVSSIGLQNAEASLTPIQIENAKNATYWAIDPDVKALELSVQKKHPYAKVSTYDLRAEVPKLDYYVAEVPLVVLLKNLGNITRVAVRATPTIYLPNGKDTNIRASYRVLIDMTPEGEILRLEKNHFTNMMSGEPPMKYNLDRPFWYR